MPAVLKRKMKKRIYHTFLLIAVVVVALFSCRQENLLEDSGARLSFSTDTVAFDTIFTTLGSTTKNFRVYNPHSQPIKVSSIHLSGGNSSCFRLNIDGSPQNKVENIEIPAKDSLYIFVEVTLDPNDDNAPLLISDSVVFITNGNIQDVKLVAWGQDVHLYNNAFIEEEVWTADKPYLIYNVAFLDTGKNLVIEPGTKIHLHKNAIIYVAGNLQINGEVDNPVTFSGDRLEELYKDVPDQWNSIHFFNGSSGEINHAEIINGRFGIIAGTASDGEFPDVEIKNTVIHNMSAYGIYAVNANLRVYNTQVSNAQYALFNVDAGGDYKFYHCTFAHYNASKNLPSITMFNKLALAVVDEFNQVVDTAYYQADLNAYFGNCIIYGGRKSEFFFENSEENELNYLFDNSLLRLEVDSFETDNPEYFRNNIFNEDPKFINLKDDFRLDTLSPAKDAASLEILNQYPVLLKTDLLGNSRIEDSKPDLGAYERREGEETEDP